MRRPAARSHRALPQGFLRERASSCVTSVMAITRAARSRMTKRKRAAPLQRGGPDRSYEVCDAAVLLSIRVVRRAIVAVGNAVVVAVAVIAVRHAVVVAIAVGMLVLDEALLVPATAFEDVVSVVLDPAVRVPVVAV